MPEMAQMPAMSKVNFWKLIFCVITGLDILVVIFQVGIPLESTAPMPSPEDLVHQLHGLPLAISVPPRSRRPAASDAAMATLSRSARSPKMNFKRWNGVRRPAAGVLKAMPLVYDYEDYNLHGVHGQQWQPHDDDHHHEIGQDFDVNRMIKKFLYKKVIPSDVTSVTLITLGQVLFDCTFIWAVVSGRCWLISMMTSLRTCAVIALISYLCYFNLLLATHQLSINVVKVVIWAITVLLGLRCLAVIPQDDRRREMATRLLARQTSRNGRHEPVRTVDFDLMPLNSEKKSNNYVTSDLANSEPEVDQSGHAARMDTPPPPPPTQVLIDHYPRQLFPTPVDGIKSL